MFDAKGEFSAAPAPPSVVGSPIWFAAETSLPDLRERQAVDLALSMAPGTHLRPARVVQMAFGNALPVAVLCEAISNRDITSYEVDGKSFVTLADACEFMRSREDVGIKGILGKIYLVGFRHYVKIGFTGGRSVSNRVAALQTACPEPLTLYGWFWGTIATERLIHSRFAKHRLEGEWFRFSPPLRSFAAAARQYEPVRNCYPDNRYE